MDSVEVAKGIGDFGMMAVSAAFFLIFSFFMMGVFVKWFIKIINGIVDTNTKMIKSLLEETKMQNVKLEEIREGLSDESMTQIKAVTGALFDLSVEKCMRIIKKIKVENNIKDRENTLIKIKALVTNIHYDRNSKLDYFKHRGKRLSEYVDNCWIDDLVKVIEKEVYNENENNGRAYSNIQTAYENIKIQFYKNLRAK